MTVRHIRRILGRELRASRIAEGMTVRELAKAVRVSPSAVTHYEKGQKEPPSSRLFLLADALGLNLAHVHRCCVRRAA